MNPSLLLLPFVGMLLLTLAVWILLFVRRVPAIRALGVMPRTRAEIARLPASAVNASDNFQNLFELPVVFYACVLALLYTDRVDAVHVVCAFGFFAFRVVHSAIHCTYNNIMQRFTVYAIGGVFLGVMVVRLALATLSDFIA